MLVDANIESWRAELKAVKEIFELYPLDFLIKVAKPDFKINSCFFFLSEDGKRYLDFKLKEFNFKPVRYEVIKGEEKVGEEWTGKKKKSLFEFLKD